MLLFTADYQQALKLGEVLVAYARIMMIGAGGVGKSSFLRGLMNLGLDQDAESTILADTKTVKPFWANAGESGDSYWTQVTDQDEIQELAGLIQLVVQGKSGGSTPFHRPNVLSTMAAAIAVRLFYPPGFVAHEVTTTQDDYVSNIKDGVVRNVLQQALKYTQSSPRNPSVPQSEVLIHVWDCGGQSVFLDVLPAFLTSRTMFLLFFDARRDLLSKCKTLSHKQGQVVETKEESFTALQLLMQWMACIHVTLSRQNIALGSSIESAPHNTHKENSPSSSHNHESLPHENISRKFPRIIPVGTHGDNQAVKGRKSEILDTLRSYCEDKAFAHLLLEGIVVDNTTAGKEIEDPGFAYVRKNVHKFTTNSLAIPTPVAWVLFRKVLQKVAKDNPIVSYKQAVAVGEACGITDEVVPSVLHFYHELAVFLHYAQIESLSQFIIADPQWLIRQFGKLLAPKELLQDISNQALWKPLQEKGILVQPLYEEVWGDSRLKAQSLADLLEHFCIAALIDPQTKATSFPDREYFIPSVLQSSSQSADSATKFVKKSSPLHLTFSTQYVPPGFFTRLATTILKESKCHLLFTRGVFRNKMTFAYGKVDKIDEFTMFEHSSSVQLTVVRTVHRQPHIPTFGSVCHDIMKLVKTCSATICQWLPLIKVDTVLRCEQCLGQVHSSSEQCPGQVHFISIPDGATADSILRCQLDHISNLTREQQYWMEVPNAPEVCYDTHTNYDCDKSQCSVTISHPVC